MVSRIAREDCSMIACHREPTLAEILSDPVIQAGMAADGVDPGEVDSLVRRIRAARLEDGPTSRPALTRIMSALGVLNLDSLRSDRVTRRRQNCGRNAE